MSKQDTIERLRGLVSAGQRAQAAVDATIAAHRSKCPVCWCGAQVGRNGADQQACANGHVGIQGMTLAARIERLAAAAIAAGELGPWSTGEQLAVCLVLDRHDWLQQHLGYTMLEAIERIGEEWLQACLTLQRCGVQLDLPG